MPSAIPHVAGMMNPQSQAQESTPRPSDTGSSSGAGAGADGAAKLQSMRSIWAHKYRGATVEDLDPPPALSVNPSTPISGALMSAYERDYTHLTVINSEDRALLGYLNIPRLKELLKSGGVSESDDVAKAMQRFRRRKGVYRTITMETPLEELEEFFEGGAPDGEKQDFAVVTDVARRFVLGVATRSDLEEFVKRRPG